VPFLLADVLTKSLFPILGLYTSHLFKSSLGHATYPDQTPFLSSIFEPQRMLPVPRPDHHSTEAPQAEANPMATTKVQSFMYVDKTPISRVPGLFEIPLAHLHSPYSGYWSVAMHKH
jgi:hypothetical protein